MANGISLANAYVSLSVSADKIAPEINKQLRGVEGDFEKTGKKAGGRFTGALATVGKAGAVAAGGAIAAGFGVALTKGFNRLKAIEEAEAKLSGLGHSAESVEKIMTNATAAVKGTAFGLGDAASAAASAVASGVKPGKELERTLKLVGDASAIAGTDFGDMAAIFNKVSAGGIIQGEELAQLGDRGIPILQLLGEEMGVTALEVKKLAAEGKVDFETFQNAIENGMGGAALESGKTFQGAMNNVGAAMGRLGANLLSGVFPKIAPMLQGVIKWLDGLMPAAERAGKAIGDALTWAGGAVQGLFDLIVKGDFTGKLREAFGVEEDHPVILFFFNLRDTVAYVLGEIRGGIEAFAAAWKYNDGEITSSGFPGVMERIGYWARQAFDYVKDVAIPAVMGLVDQFRSGEGAGGSLRVGLERIWSVAKDAFGFFRDEGLPALQNLWRFIVERLWPDIKTAFIDRIWPAMKQVGTVIWNLWNEDAKPALQGLWRFIRDTLAPFLVDFYENGVKPTFKGIGDVIEGAYKFSRDVLRNFKSEVQSLKDRFVSVRDGIRDAWRGLTNIIARPINAVIDKINAFLSNMKAALNQIPGVDLTGSWTIRKIILDTASGTIGGGPNQMLAAGGRVGGWSPHDRADNIPAMLTAGEYVLPVAATRSLASRFGPGFLESLRRGLPGFASGGAVSHGDKRVGGFLDDGWEWLAELVTNAKGWVKRKFEDLMSGFGNSWPAVAAKGAAMSGVDGLAGWIKANIFGGGEMSGGQRANYGGAYGWAPQGMPWQAIYSLIKMVAPEAIMTSNYRPGAITASGVPSLHGQGRAVDIVSGNMRATFLKLLPLLKWSQLFYSPMGGLQVGYRDAIVHRTHFDHIHAALADGGFVRPPVFDRGGTLAPGLNLIDNATGGPESLRNADLPVDLSAMSLSALRDLFVEAAVRGAEKAHQLELMGKAGV